jgi:CDGSH-type Zn-finger protein/uncharacterized Fe-S cluster protein YjdI
VEPTIHINSREQLIAALGEAAEIEHNLMCCYLYAMFSLKTREDEGLSAEELAAVRRWRRVILGVALEEMTHLTLVANLISALGTQPHFERPNFPVNPGMYPAGVVIELAPFDMDTLDHFIFLERPRSAEVADGQSFVPGSYRRSSAKPRLMPFGGDYATVGDLYAAIRDAFVRLTARMGEPVLFCGEPAVQIRPADATLPGIVAVLNLDCALRALDTIVIQGEGSVTEGDSHFARFRGIKGEYLELLAKRPDFTPARPAARNPVMRPPIVPTGRVHVTAEPAASLIDLANASYVHMLRMLQQVYAVRARPPVQKRTLLGCAFLLMRAVTVIAEELTRLPASDSAGCNAGMSFATVRMITPIQKNEIEAAILPERNALLLQEIRLHTAGIPALQAAADTLQQVQTALETLATTWTPTMQTPKAPAAAATTPPATAPVPAAAAPAPAAASAAAAAAALPAGNGNVEHIRGSKIDVAYEGKRCIHSRHCVLDLPQVFLANTPGEWIKPDETTAERLAAIAEKCPSGAIRYLRKDGGPQEAAPPVNTAHVRENGPLALHAPLVLRGTAIGYRATLCRCGRSNNKPFCDGSHAGQFSATGEPASAEIAPLTTRDGALQVDPQPNGPLCITGNLEICAGTGRTVARVTEAKLCRCGGSRNKPFCDGTHLSNGFTAD